MVWCHNKSSLSLTVFFIFFANLTSLNAQPCTADNDCQYFIEGSACVSNICKCSADFTLSSDGTSCLPIVDTYGGSCNETVQCSSGLNAGGVCQEDNTCTCKDGFHYLKGKCWRSVKLGGSCSGSEQCYAAYDFTGMECSSGVCQCRSQYYERAGACRRKRAAGEDCAVDTDCQCGADAGKCDSRVCKCSDGTLTSPKMNHLPHSSVRLNHPKSDKAATCAPGSFPCESSQSCSDSCVPELGSACSATSDQCAEGVMYAVCLDDTLCGCESSLRSRGVDNRVCNKVAQAINGNCVDGGQCAIFGDGAKCDGSKCVCSSDSHYDSDTMLCRSSKYLGDSCTTDGDCVTLSGGSVACTSSVCTCVPGSHQANGKLDCRPDAHKVGDQCTESSDCTFQHATCDSTAKKCQCEQYFFADEAGTCVQGIGSTCLSSTDCGHIADTVCNNSSCGCKEGFVSSSNFQKCLEVVGFDEECEQTQQCSPDLGDLKICSIDGKCSCQEGAQFILGKCYAMKQLGDKCSARPECIPPLSEIEAYMCQNAICACQYGYQREGNYCISV